jgi:hypothetical protein
MQEFHPATSGRPAAKPPAEVTLVRETVSPETPALRAGDRGTRAKKSATNRPKKPPGAESLERKEVQKLGSTSTTHPETGLDAV